MTEERLQRAPAGPSTAQSAGIDINTIGVILMAVGAVGFVLSLVFWSSWRITPLPVLAS